MKVTDPVCKMKFEDKDAAGISSFRWEKFYFCSAACKVKFENDPLKYLLTSSFIPPGDGSQAGSGEV